MIDILKQWIPVDCPNCRFSNTVRLEDVALGKRIICSGCHQYINLVDKDASMYRADKRIDAAVKELEDELSKLSSLKITF